jgi:hypothetical protein
MTANMMVSLATCASTKRLRHCGEGRNPVFALLPWVPAFAGTTAEAEVIGIGCVEG